MTSPVTQKQLDNIFKVCRVITLKDPQARHWREAFAPCDPVKKPKGVAKKMSEDPKSWGVVVSNCAEYGYIDAYKQAQQLFAFGLVPKHITNIACIGSNHYSTKKAETLRQAGVTVIYDGSKQTSYETPTDGFVRCPCNKTRLLYTGSVPQDIQEYLDRIVDIKYDGLIRDAWDSTFLRSFTASSEDIDLSLAVKTFTFGKKNYEQTATRSSLSLPSWRRERVYADDFENYSCKVQEGFVSPEELKTILAFWKKRLKEAGLDLAVSCLERTSLSILSEVGKTIGVDKDIDAYCAGVPAQDILAG